MWQLTSANDLILNYAQLLKKQDLTSKLHPNDVEMVWQGSHRVELFRNSDLANITILLRKKFNLFVLNTSLGLPTTSFFFFKYKKEILL